MFLAMGGKHEWKHSRSRENVKTTRLQDFLSEYMQRNPDESIPVHIYAKELGGVVIW